MEDSKIIAMYWQRNEEAIRSVSKKYGSYCLLVAKNILNTYQDAEECVNDTWLKSWNTIPPQRPNYLQMFLAKITRNIAIDRWRTNTRKKRGSGEMNLVLDELEECIAASNDVEREVELTILGETINTFLHSLPSRESDIFLRRYFYIETTASIAKKYHLKESNVLVILSRTRKKLKRQLQKEGYFP